MPIRLVLADDHPLILDALERLFQQEGDFQVLARCVNGEETWQAVCQYRPDVLVLDIRMPGMDGLAVLREMHAEKLPTRVVLLTAVLDEHAVLEATRLGVCGVVLKEMVPQQLVQCVRKVYAGDRWVERHSVARALEKMVQREVGARQVTRVLTTRELDIVRLVATGLRNRQIAEQLCIGEGTVKVHLHNIYEKLQVSSRLELALYARSNGLI